MTGMMDLDVKLINLQFNKTCLAQVSWLWHVTVSFKSRNKRNQEMNASPSIVLRYKLTIMYLQ